MEAKRLYVWLWRSSIN